MLPTEIKQKPITETAGALRQDEPSGEGTLYCALKYALDLVFAALLLVFFSLPLLIISILIRLDSRGPAIYRQKRMGASGRTFIILKFRSMKVGTPVLTTEEMQQQKINPYTRFGQLLRKTSLDELPQLINVLRGEMTFIGPRPALPSQDKVISLRVASRVDWIRPGITGLAQVMGRDDLDDTTKVVYDSEYCRNLGFRQDLWILTRTFGAIVSRRGNK